MSGRAPAPLSRRTVRAARLEQLKAAARALLRARPLDDDAIDELVRIALLWAEAEATLPEVR